VEDIQVRLFLFSFFYSFIFFSILSGKSPKREESDIDQIKKKIEGLINAVSAEDQTTFMIWLQQLAQGMDEELELEELKRLILQQTGSVPQTKHAELNKFITDIAQKLE